jgi:glycosyltransferase involved in cell wall biosynthesis
MPNVNTMVGIDIEQFVLDPFASGVQRVLQYLAKEWPADLPARFVIPRTDHFKLLTPEQAYALISIPFDSGITGLDLGKAVTEHVDQLETETCSETELMSMFTSWFLPEVTYEPSVLRRFEAFQQRIPTAMIGYDVLPMTHPGNYMFTPGTLANVSEFFRLVASTDTLICISDYAKESIMETLRRDPNKSTTVAHPGGDHIPIHSKKPKSSTTISYLRLGTIEARKAPLEILEEFERAITGNPDLDIELHFVGKPASVDIYLNDAIERAIARELPIRWTQGATDSEVMQIIQESSIFLSYGTEGYGIPVLESIRMGTPVVFDGIQPAAEIMEAHGTHRFPLDQVFTHPLGQSVSESDQARVPGWIGYVDQVTEQLKINSSRQSL